MAKLIPEPKPPETKDEQMEWVFHYAIALTEEIWKILDERLDGYSPACNAEHDNENETVKATAKMLNEMHYELFNLLAGHLSNVLAIKPIQKYAKTKLKLRMNGFLSKLKQETGKFYLNIEPKNLVSLLKKV